MVLLFGLSILLIASIEGYDLVKKRQWRELAAMGMLLGTAVLLAFAGWLDLPTPINWLQDLFEPIGRMIYK